MTHQPILSLTSRKNINIGFELTCNRFEVVHSRSIELADRGQLCNYATHLFTTACVTHVEYVRLFIDETIGGFNGDN